MTDEDSSTDEPLHKPQKKCARSSRGRVVEVVVDSECDVESELEPGEEENDEEVIAEDNESSSSDIEV